MLRRFLPQAGSNYARGRNFVPGVVSGLSPYVRHRLITETEIVGAVLQQHSLKEAEKFIQEICWRTYWKGWLEMRPKVWSEYLQELRTLRARMAEDPDLDDRVPGCLGQRAPSDGIPSQPCQDVVCEHLGSYVTSAMATGS